MTNQLGIVRVPTKNNLGFATMTRQTAHSLLFISLLKERFDVLVEAVAAKLLRGLQRLLIVFGNISKQTTGNLQNFVVFRFSLPTFHAFNFVFEFLYSRRDRRMRLLYCDCLEPRLNDSLQKVVELTVELSRLAQSEQRLRNVGGGLEAGKGGSGFGKHKSIPNVM